MLDQYSYLGESLGKTGWAEAPGVGRVPFAEILNFSPILSFWYPEPSEDSALEMSRWPQDLHFGALGGSRIFQARAEGRLLMRCEFRFCCPGTDQILTCSGWIYPPDLLVWQTGRVRAEAALLSPIHLFYLLITHRLPKPSRALVSAPPPAALGFPVDFLRAWRVQELPSELSENPSSPLAFRHISSTEEF